MNDITFKPPEGTYGIVYRIISPSGKSYIGQTTKALEDRRKGHVKASKREGGCRALNTAIRKYGANRFGIVIVATARNQEGLDCAECFYIDRFKTNNPVYGYNIKRGGFHDWFTKPHNEADREKLKRDNVGEKNPFYGRHHTEETKEKLRKPKSPTTKYSEWQQGRKLTEEHKKNIGLGQLGRKRSEETRKNLSNATWLRYHFKEIAWG